MFNFIKKILRGRDNNLIFKGNLNEPVPSHPISQIFQGSYPEYLEERKDMPKFDLKTGKKLFPFCEKIELVKKFDVYTGEDLSRYEIVIGLLDGRDVALWRTTISISLAEFSNLLEDYHEDNMSRSKILELIRNGTTVICYNGYMN